MCEAHLVQLCPCLLHSLLGTDSAALSGCHQTQLIPVLTLSLLLLRQLEEGDEVVSMNLDLVYCFFALCVGVREGGREGGREGERETNLNILRLQSTAVIQCTHFTTTIVY